MNFNSIKLAVTLVLLLPFQQVLQADDTEIFTAGNIDNTVNPQVMIIFDNSGSMDNYTPYDPEVN